MGTNESVTQQKCTMKDPDSKSKMQELIESGAKNPFSIKMSDWYYIQGHADNCEYCTRRFEKLAKEARKNGWFEGPTTLRRYT